MEFGKGFWGKYLKLYSWTYYYSLLSKFDRYKVLPQRYNNNNNPLQRHRDGGTRTDFQLCYCEQPASTYNSITLPELAQWQRTRLLLFQQLALCLKSPEIAGEACSAQRRWRSERASLIGRPSNVRLADEPPCSWFTNCLLLCESQPASEGPAPVSALVL